jgi:hypothetical protein
MVSTKIIILIRFLGAEVGNVKLAAIDGTLLQNRHKILNMRAAKWRSGGHQHREITGTRGKEAYDQEQLKDP